ncbi:SctD/MshK family protein [Rhizobium etli]|uniref:SctD/MshK family protein n=1 Tax=Rhizobium etli TaxID=29449 RepID=UPI000383A21D|nr:hypothetical protein [Rhizobium etli]AGS25294.1 hypothetical protein REMIM1_PE00204 [Rhizobium etli bv. mimosae str. Mim1]
MNDVVSLDFEVLSGLYAGQTGSALLGPNIIGSGLESDMIFIEQGLEPCHFRVTLLCNSLEVEALAGGFRVEGNGNIAAGERMVVSLPAVIHAGAMSILWSVQEAVQTQATYGRRLTFPVLVMVLFSCLGLGTISTIFSYYGSPDAASTKSIDARPASKLPIPPHRTGQSVQAAAKSLQEEVDRAGLLNIQVGSAEGIVTAKGTVSPVSVSDWQKIQQRFDQRMSAALTLVNGVVIKEESAPSAIAIEAVWSGTQPYLLIGGQKYFVGALLDNGWALDRIEDGRVLLNRNGRLAALHY